MTNCSVVCIYMSIILLISSGIYKWMRFRILTVSEHLGCPILLLKKGKNVSKKRTATHIVVATKIKDKET